MKEIILISIKKMPLQVFASVSMRVKNKGRTLFSIIIIIIMEIIESSL